jgi:hypothetical protein
LEIVKLEDFNEHRFLFGVQWQVNPNYSSAGLRNHSGDAFQSGFQASLSLQGLMMAICLQEYVTDETTGLFINAALSRGTNVIEFFKDKRKALEWLGIKNEEPKP